MTDVTEMQRVYVVMNRTYVRGKLEKDDSYVWWLYGVFKTRERADNYIAKAVAKGADPADYKVQERFVQ